MADPHGDSNIDDQTSLVNFMAWAKDMTGSKAIMEDQISRENTQEHNHEFQQDRSQNAESKQDSDTAPAQTEITVQEEKVNSIPPEISSTQAANTAVIARDVSVPGRDTDQKKSKAQFPIISVAHKAGKKPVEPKPEIIITNGLDNDFQEEPRRSLATMTHTQRRLQQKVDPQLYEEHSALPKHTVETQLRPRNASVALQEGTLDKSKEVVPEQNPEKMNGEGSKVTTESKRADGLFDSIHARKNYKPFQSRMQPGGSPRPQAPLLNQDLNSSHIGDNAKRDPMTYYVKKQKEYYPPAQQTNNGAKMMLQSKDPNKSMRSPTKAFSGFNPQAAEYKLTEPVETATKDAINDSDQHTKPDWLEKPVPCLPPPPLEQQLDEYWAKDTATRSTTEDGIDGSTVVDTPQPKQEKTDSETGSTQSQEDDQSEKRLDLTPMLNVLGARTIKAPDTVTSQESDDNGPPVKTENNEELLALLKIMDEEKRVPGYISRTLILRDLPYNSDYTLVQSVIEGSIILKMDLDNEEQCAYVKLASHDHCQRLVEAYGSGKIIKHKGKTNTIRLELSTEPDEQDDVLDAYLECGATRAVEVEDVDLDLTMRALYRLGQGPTSSRVVEAINDSFRGGTRSVLFRFTCIHDAVSFRSSLRRTDDWKDKKTEFAQDPCA